jgi:hypothetical protein
MKLMRAGVLLVLVSCGSVGVLSSNGDLPPRPATPIADEYVDLVALEAKWKCDVERYAFEDLGSLTAELDERLVGAGISTEEYQAFVLLLDEEDELRLHVRWAYEDLCN